jgi:hypothetical protein
MKKGGSIIIVWNTAILLSALNYMEKNDEW